MPRITTFNIELEIVKRASTLMTNDIANELKIDRDHVTLQVSEDKFVFDGKIIKSHPFVELAIFDRPEDIENKIALIVTKRLLEAGCESVDLYHIKLEKRRYFENGKHF